MAEILELDNVIINLQDLIKPPTILILLSTGTTRRRRVLWDGRLELRACWGMSVEQLVFNWCGSVGLSSLFTVSVHPSEVV